MSEDKGFTNGVVVNYLYEGVGVKFDIYSGYTDGSDFHTLKEDDLRLVRRPKEE